MSSAFFISNSGYCVGVPTTGAHMSGRVVGASACKHKAWVRSLAAADHPVVTK